MKKLVLFAVIIFGFLIAIAAFLYGAANGIPYQDPTQQQLEYQIHMARVYRLVFILGVIVMGTGIFFLRKMRKSGNNPDRSFSSDD